MSGYTLLFMVIAALLVLQTVDAFAPPSQQKLSPFLTNNAVSPLVVKIGKFAATAAVVVSTSPLIVLAEEADNYEYGAVSAPIGVGTYSTGITYFLIYI